MLSLTGINDQITDLTIDGNGTNNFVNQFSDLGLDGIGAVADHVQMINTRAEAITMDATSTQVTNSIITGMASSTVQTYGILAISSNNFGGIKIDHNYITNSGIDGVAINGTNNEVTNNYLANNHCYSGSGGGQLVVYNNQSRTNGVVISGNTIEQGCSSLSGGMELNGNNLAISNNVVQNQQWFGVIFEAGAHYTFTGNVVRNSGTGLAGNPISDGVTVNPGVSSFQITANRLIDDQSVHTQTYGVYVQPRSSNNYVITDNDLTGNLTGAINDGGTGSSKQIFGNLPVSLSSYFNSVLGVGTTTPLSKLAVGGNASIGNDYNIAAPSNGLIVEGNVGIGTTSPSQSLSVQGNGYFSGTLTLGALSGAVSAANGVVSAGTLSVGSGGTGSTTLSGLLVGNGTSAIQAASIASPLTLSGTTLSIQQATAVLSGYLASTDWTIFNGKLGSSTVSSLSANYDPVWNGSAFANGAIYDTGTAIGIGTTSPYAQLSIATPNGATGSVGTLFAIASSTATATTTLFTVTNPGNVGIRATSPTERVNDSGTPGVMRLVSKRI
jgi:hypothetical protein